MARVINKLSARQAETLKKEGMHSDGGGLYLRIEDGNRYWVFRYASRIPFKGKNGRQGKPGDDRQIGIGPTYTWSLAQAREKARQYRQMLSDGKDPIEERRAQEASSAVENAKGLMTFDQAAEQYIAAHEASWSSVHHANQWRTSLKTYASPIIGALPVKAIDVGLVLKVLEPHWLTTTETMKRVRGRIELILDWAKVRGHRDGENPARWKGHLQYQLAKPSKVKKVEHHPALPYTEIGAFMEKLRKRETIGAKAVEFCILTVCRTGDILGQKSEDRPPMEWPHVDFEKRLWIIPATKNESEHRVPLSAPAIAVLEYMKTIRHSDRVFPIARIDRDLNAIRDDFKFPDCTVHGMRSTFRDWAAEQTNFPRELAEKALAHTIGDETERAYQRGDLLTKRAKLMDAWANYCARPATAANNVTPIRAGGVPG